MLELTEQNAAEVLHAAGHLADPRQVRVRELSGGVSNVVLLVESIVDDRTGDGSLWREETLHDGKSSHAKDSRPRPLDDEQGPERFVVKQARGKLRVQADWRCSIERIWGEVEVLEAYNDLLRDSPIAKMACVPSVYWSDRDLYAYAMTAADADCITWKEELLAGQFGWEEATLFGSLLGTMHAESWHEPEIAKRFDDRSYFDQLRLDPYYRFAASKYRPLDSQLMALADQTWTERHALVHGDFSPKNLLMQAGRAMLIDFEVGHYGDPAFDVGFFLSHLTLKAIHMPNHAETLLKMADSFWALYMATIHRKASLPDWEALSHRIALNLAGCLVARVHGKSPVEYLTSQEQLRAVRLAESVFDFGPDAAWETTCETLRSEILIG